MKIKAAALLLLSTALVSNMFAGDDDRDHGKNAVPPLDHVWVIMMENHAYGQLLNNPNAPFINAYANAANLATDYFAVAHPSSTNYLEVVGGSNFGVLNDFYPDWHNPSCLPNLISGVSDETATANICPIAGTGTDAPTPVTSTNESSAPDFTPLNNIDGTQQHQYAAAPTVGETIADQLVAAHRSWKSYQESLPDGVVDNVNFADGFFSNLTNFNTYPAMSGNVVPLYAAKHNPFVYFKSVQENSAPGLGLSQVVDFEGWNGLYADLRSGRVPNYSLIAPNQCNDQHGRPAATVNPSCAFDPSSNGTQTGLNPALIYRGDVTVQKIVNAIHASPAWREGHNVIVTLWDENDYSAVPNVNQVMAIVDTNYGPHHLTSGKFYTHFSLLKTIEEGFDLPCLNHACDPGTAAMSDLFAGH